ncbi:MAG: carboxypeptidase regulatory-like domain-containing protein [Bryobacteraceae bacterium]
MARLFVAAALLFLASGLNAQVDTYTSIRGLITDPTGAAVSGAVVTVKNAATGEERSTSSDSAGYYSLPSMAPGTYAVTVTHPGFKKGEVTDRVARVAQVAQVDVSLQVGQASESVTVSAAGAELIDTSSAATSGTIVTKLVENLPLNGRNFFDLAVTLPNVSLQGIGTQISMGSFSQNAVFGTSVANPIFRSSGIFAAGNRDSSVNVSIDGVNVQSSNYGTTNPQQPPSAIEEVKIQVSGMNAEFGYGVASVNVITKSGSNRLHGEVYEFLRNEKLDSNYFFANLAGQRRRPYRQNQFGGAAGGPILANKLFFFAAYEGMRVRQSTFTIATVPPDELRNGDFSAFRTPQAGGTFGPTPTIYNPYRFNAVTGLREPFPGNRIPIGPTTLCAPRPSCVDPVSYKFLQDYVARSNAVVDGIPRLIGDTRQRLNQDQGVLRVDWVKSVNTRVYGRFSRMVSPSVGTGLQSLEGLQQDGKDHVAAVHWTQLISPTTVNDFTVGFARPNWYYGRDLTVPDVSAAIGLRNTSGLRGGPSFGGTGYGMNASLTFVLVATDNIFQLGDDFTKVIGRHNLKFGFQGIERRFYFPIQAQDKGSFNFSSIFTEACPAGRAACETALRDSARDRGGNAFASYLLGASLNGLFQLNGAEYMGHKRYYGAYAQDSWRVSIRLTLNYGLRYDYWGPFLVPRNTVPYYNDGTGELRYVLQNPTDYLSASTDYGRNAPLTPGVPREGHTKPKLNFSPRLGVAYSLRSDTVFRAGFGIYYNGNINNNQFADISTGVGPFRLRYETIVPSSDPLPSLFVDGSFPVPGPTAIPTPNATPPYTFRFPQRHYPNETVLEWQAGIQQRIGTQWATEIGYQGTHAYRLNQFIDSNAPDLPQGPLAGLSLQQRRKFPQWGVLGTWAPIGFGRYNALSATLKNNNWKGLTYLASFTFAKNIVSSYAGSSDQGNVHYRYAHIWAGPAQLTPRLRLVNSLSYDLPFGKGKAFGNGASRGADLLIGGWRFSGIIDTTTGIPNKVTTVDNSGTGYGAHPDRICDPRNVPGGQGRLQWFNTGCFRQTEFGVWGNSPLGVFEDPGIANANLAILKSIPVGGEGRELAFRTDLFNAFNHTQWGAANNSLTTGNVNYGRILATRPPRQIQLSLTFRF